MFSVDQLIGSSTIASSMSMTGMPSTIGYSSVLSSRTSPATTASFTVWPARFLTCPWAMRVIEPGQHRRLGDGQRRLVLGTNQQLQQWLVDHGTLFSAGWEKTAVTASLSATSPTPNMPHRTCFCKSRHPRGTPDGWQGGLRRLMKLGRSYRSDLERLRASRRPSCSAGRSFPR